MNYLRLIIIALAVLFIAACGNDSLQEGQNQQAQQDSMNNVGEFEAVTQSGDSFNVTDLQGNWWVADFIFTNCTTVCLPMTANMIKLQGMLEDEGLDDVKLVSFSVDPERDTPEVLTEYAEEYGADLNRWTFLTGYEFEAIKDYAVGTFKNWVAPPEDGDDQVGHASYFFLVNPDGEIVAPYSGTQKDQMEDILNDIKRLK